MQRSLVRGRSAARGATWSTVRFHSHKSSTLLVDEPDAHLEILRQKQVDAPLHCRIFQAGPLAELFEAMQSHDELSKMTQDP